MVISRTNALNIRGGPTHKDVKRSGGTGGSTPEFYSLKKLAKFIVV